MEGSVAGPIAVCTQPMRGAGGPRSMNAEIDDSGGGGVSVVRPTGGNLLRHMMIAAVGVGTLLGTTEVYWSYLLPTVVALGFSDGRTRPVRRSLMNASQSRRLRLFAFRSRPKNRRNISAAPRSWLC